jgi:hypothetical protein
MKKIKLFITTLIIAVSSMNAQTAGNHIQQIDNAVKTLAEELNRKLVEERVSSVTLYNFSFEGMVTPFSTYWGNQLLSELTNMRNRSYTFLLAGTPDWIISGEMVIITDIIRVYARLIRQSDQAIVSSAYVDLEWNENIMSMLSDGYAYSAPFFISDEWEPDSMENPVAYTIGADSNVSLMNRTLHTTNDSYGDEDFFLLQPTENGRVVMETVSEIDTYMELYDAGTRQLLAEDDDSGDNLNAKISHNLQAGKQYIVKVRGFDRGNVGHYGFRAYTNHLNFSHAINYEIGANAQNAQQVHQRLVSDGSTMFLLQPRRNGTLVMETLSDIDTYMELYDADTQELLAEDDDSGDDYNAQIIYNVQSGKRYIARVRGYSPDATGNYSFRAYF